MMSTFNSESNETGSGPQDIINEFWESLISKKPGKVMRVFPRSLYADLLPSPRRPGLVKGQSAAESYETAAKECRARVKQIVRECHRTNEKFTDSEFDITDQPTNCLEGLMRWYRDPETAPSAGVVSAGRLGFALRTLIEADVLCQDAAPFQLKNTADLLLKSRPNLAGQGPQSWHRIDWIFDAPKFQIDGYSSSDVVQGANGDCWFIAAVATICSNPDLMQKVCVERDEECGVYGFVFYRDGEWTWTVVDDNLFLSKPDFDERGDTYDPIGVKEAKYRKSYQTGSEALYFASCAHENETWLPLLEKAYAKIHGDYDAISGGISGEAVEDLTGGVTSKILTDRILSTERLWKELMKVNKDFLFSASSPGSYGGDSDARRGLALSHAYSIIKAVEEESEDRKTKHRLLLIRNPWGKRANAAMGEWTGSWSDGSSEWDSYWMKKLGHRFGDDGLFWMSYEDLLKRFDLLDRTRLFDHNWTVVQQWTSVSVGWVTGFMNTKFSVEIKRKGPTVFQLCQLDDRYFFGLKGKYDFDLHFIVQQTGTDDGDYIARARGAWFGNRSISAEIDIEPGVYEVVPKIVAKRDADAPDVHEVVTRVAGRNPQKLRQIGLNHDLANAKATTGQSEEEEKRHEAKRKGIAEKERKDRENADKDREAFEIWQKEEKAEYEAWKKEKQRSEKQQKLEKGSSGTASPISPTLEARGASTSATEDQISEPASIAADSSFKDAATQAAMVVPQVPQTPLGTVVPESELMFKMAELNTNDYTALSDDDEAQDAPVEVPENQPRASSRVDLRERGRRPHLYYNGPRNHYREMPPQEADPRARSPMDRQTKPWNAVCVVGLRVHSLDPEVNIKLVQPKNVEEGALLNVGRKTAAGATM